MPIPISVKFGNLNHIVLLEGFETSMSEAELARAVNNKTTIKIAKWVMPLCIVVALWTSLGTAFLSFIAGLQTIDRSLYEAAAVDGIKNRWQELWFITLPSMRPQLMFGAVLSITQSFNFGGIVTVLCGFPSVDYAAHTIMHHLDDYGGQRYEVGYASAIAVILFAIMITCNMVIKKALSKVGQ